MTRVEKQTEIFGVCILHKSVDFRFGLNNGAHVMVVCKSNAHVLGDLAELVYAGAELIPFLVVHNVFFLKNRLVGALYGMTLFAHSDDLCAHFL